MAKKRCKEHFQGDRCKLELGHDSTIPEKDRIHVGQFNNFQLDTDSIEIEETESSDLPDANCVTLANGDCVGKDCMHDPNHFLESEKTSV